MYAKGFILGLIIGAAAGSVVSLLYAPVKGHEARDIVRKKTKMAANKVGKVTIAAGSRVQKVGEGIKQAM